MNEYVTPTDQCPFCSHSIDRAADLVVSAREDRPPRPGDLTLCLNCLTALEWNPEMRLQLFDETNLEPLLKAKLAYLRWVLEQAPKAAE